VAASWANTLAKQKVKKAINNFFIEFGDYVVGLSVRNI
jgi:hypothetical protein